MSSFKNVFQLLKIKMGGEKLSEWYIFIAKIIIISPQLFKTALLK